MLRAGRPFARIGLMCERDARDHFDRFLAAIGPRWGIATEALAGQNGTIAPRSKMLPLGPIERPPEDPAGQHSVPQTHP